MAGGVADGLWLYSRKGFSKIMYRLTKILREKNFHCGKLVRSETAKAIRKCSAVGGRFRPLVIVDTNMPQLRRMRLNYHRIQGLTRSRDEILRLGAG